MQERKIATTESWLGKHPWLVRLLFFFLGAVVFLASLTFAEWSWSFAPEALRESDSIWIQVPTNIVLFLPLIVAGALLWRRAGQGRGVGILAFFLGASSPVIVFFVWIVWGLSIALFIHTRDFDAEDWRNQAPAEFGSDWPPRLCMVDDLIDGKYLDDLNREEVLQLLGTTHGRPTYSRQDYDLQYYLGPIRAGIRLDYEWLFVRFGPDGQVARYWIYTN